MVSLINLALICYKYTISYHHGILPQLAAGIPGQSNDEESFKILNRFGEWGGNFIDTADIYGHGNSETIVGKWLER